MEKIKDSDKLDKIINLVEDNIKTWKHSGIGYMDSSKRIYKIKINKENYDGVIYINVGAFCDWTITIRGNDFDKSYSLKPKRKHKKRMKKIYNKILQEDLNNKKQEMENLLKTI